jgi:hypothetical protein
MISTLTSAGVVFQQEFVESHPTASYAHHDCGAENTHQTQFLGFAELKKEESVRLTMMFRS